MDLLRAIAELEAADPEIAALGDDIRRALDRGEDGDEENGRFNVRCCEKLGVDPARPVPVGMPAQRQAGAA